MSVKAYNLINPHFSSYGKKYYRMVDDETRVKNIWINNDLMVLNTYVRMNDYATRVHKSFIFLDWLNSTLSHLTTLCWLPALP